MNPIADPSTNTTRSHSAAFRWILVTAPLFILFAAYLLTSGRITAKPPTTSQTKLLPADAPDDWRRTAHGWERTHSWPTTTSASWRLFHINALSLTTSTTPRSRTASPPRLDTHPAALALAQLLTSLLALTLFRTPQQKSHYLSSLLTTISRSFRASAFGS